MPFPDAHFATVVSNSVLEHIPDVEPVVREVARVLKPGGWFHFCVPGPNFRRFLSVARALDAVGLRGPAEAYRRLFDRISRHRYYNTPEEWDAATHRAPDCTSNVGGATSPRRPWPPSNGAIRWDCPPSWRKNSPVAGSSRPRAGTSPSPKALLRRFYEEPMPEEGAYLFFVVRRK